MDDYLPHKTKEVFRMLNYAWNEEEAREALIEYGTEQGIRQESDRQAAIQEHKEQQRALDMLRDGVEPSFIAKYSPLPLERIQELGRSHGLL